MLSSMMRWDDVPLLFARHVPPSFDFWLLRTEQPVLLQQQRCA